MRGPFDGVRVVDLSRILAGPTVTRLLVELGADVVKVEAAPTGDPSRSLPYLRDGRSGYYIQANRGKRSVCVDFRSERGTELVFALASRADVVVENFRPGVLDAIGCSWERLHAASPRTILCSVTALGYGGPLSEKPGYDTIGAALSGIASVSGPVDGPPMMPSAAIGDTMTGVHGFAGVATALFQRERTGLGDWVQVSLVDTYMHCHEINIQAFTGSGGRIVPGPSGGNHATVCPAGMFRCGDRYLFIACVSPDDWRRLASAMGAPELADDPRYTTNELRVAHRSEVIGLVDAWLSAVDDPHAALAELDRCGVASELIYTVPEALQHPHNLARRAVRTVTDDVWGEITIPGLPIRMASLDRELDLVASDLGADNESVLTEILGLNADALSDLYSARVISRAGTPTVPTRSIT